MINGKTLVLNKSWFPIDTITSKKAIKLVYSEKAKIIDPSRDFASFTWKDWSDLKHTGENLILSASNIYFKIPSVIVLLDFNKYVARSVKLTRRNVYRRDNFVCQYCGLKGGLNNLNIDHIIPRSKGGQSTWDNLVVSCIKCNVKKANKSPEQAGMKLLSQPKKPNFSIFKDDYIKIEDWKHFISEAYFSVELQ